MVNGIVRRDPWVGLRQTMDRLFDDHLFVAPSQVMELRRLPIDVAEDAGGLVVEASLPGIDRESIDVQVRDGVLSITATHQTTEEDGGARFFRRERTVGQLSRKIGLPTKIDEGAVEAELAQGVLTVRLPYSEDETPKRVEIKVAE